MTSPRQQNQIRECNFITNSILHSNDTGGIFVRHFELCSDGKKSNLVSCEIINALCKWISPLAMIYLSTCNRLVSRVKCISQVCLDQVDLQGCLVKLILILFIKMGNPMYCVNDTILWARCSKCGRMWREQAKHWHTLITSSLWAPNERFNTTSPLSCLCWFLCQFSSL